MSAEIHDWLNGLGLGELYPAFGENRIDWEILPELTSEDLREMGVQAIGDRRRLLKAIAQLAESAEAVSDAASPPPDASRRQVTVLFADLVGFTSLTSRMDAEDVHALLNRYFEAVDATVMRYGGRIDKHIGDAVMAVFGAPVAHTNDPERAVRAGLEIHAAVAALDPPLHAHVGLASGQVVASSTGSAAHVEYTVTGDGVNLASRLTDMAGRDQVFASQAVRRAVGGLFEAESQGRRSIKGLDEPVEIWRILGEADARPSRERIVGRDKEVRALRSAMREGLDAGGVQVVVLRGEPGIGKSRLLAEIDGLPEARDYARHRCVALDFGGAANRAPTHSLARSLLGLGGDSNDESRTAAAEKAIRDGRVAATSHAHLNALLDLPPPPDQTDSFAALDSAARARGRQAALAALARANAPVLIEVEDAHWANAQDMEDLSRLAAELRHTPSMIVLTTRKTGDPIDDAWIEGLRGAPIKIIDLTPLPAEQARALAADEGHVDAALLEVCVARAGGNPLFLQLLIRNADRLDADDLPDSIQGIVQARLDGLPARERRAIEAASVLGQRFPSEALRHLMSDPQGVPIGLLEKDLMVERGDELAFTHALIRDGAYESLLKPARASHHRRAADWYAERDPALRARHLDRAGDVEAPAAYLDAAAGFIGRFEADLALPLLERALELKCEADLQFALTCALGEVLRAVGQSERAFATFTDASAAARGDEQVVRAQVGLAQVARQASRYEEALNALGIAQKAAERLNSDKDLATIHYLRGNLFFPLGRLGEMFASTKLALSHAEAANSVPIQVGGNSNFGDANYMKGAMLSADKFYTKAIDLAREEGLARDLAANLHNRAAARLYFDNHRARDDVIESLEVARKCFAPVAECVALAVLSCVHLLSAEVETGLEVAGENVRIASEVGAQRFEALALGYMTRLLFLSGRREEACRTGGRGVELSLSVARNFCSPKNLSALALATEDAGEQDRLLEKGADILAEGCVSHSHFFFYSDAIRIMLTRGDWDRAEAFANELEKFTEAEPLPLPDLTIRQAKRLAQIGRDGGSLEADDGTAELRRICEKIGVRQTLAGNIHGPW